MGPTAEWFVSQCWTGLAQTHHDFSCPRSQLHREGMHRILGISKNIHNFEASRRHNHIPFLPSFSCSNFHSSTLRTFSANLRIYRSPFLKTSWARNLAFHSAVSLAKSLNAPTHQYHRIPVSRISSTDSPVSQVNLFYDCGMDVSEECLTVTTTAQFHSFKYP